MKYRKRPGREEKERLQVDTSEPSPPVQAMIKEIRTEVIGQDAAVGLAAESIEIDQSGLYEEGDLAGIVLGIGPPGSGKTTLAYAFAHAWIGRLAYAENGDRIEAVTKIDCTQYTTQWEISNLIGAAKGLVGYEDDTPLRQKRLDRYHQEVDIKSSCDWLLKQKAKTRRRGSDRLTFVEIAQITEAIDDHVEPFKKVLLLDELERAHRGLINFVLSWMNGKRLELTDGTFTDLTRTMLFMASNLNERLFTGEKDIGFGGKRLIDLDPDDYRDIVHKRTMTELKRRFPPAFVSRVKESIAIFHPLTEEQFSQILDLELARIGRLFEETYRHRLNDISFEFTDEFRKLVLAEGVDPVYGARRLKKTIRRMVLKRLARLLNWQQSFPKATKIEHGDTIVFDRVGGKVGVYKAS